MHQQRRGWSGTQAIGDVPIARLRFDGRGTALNFRRPRKLVLSIHGLCWNESLWLVKTSQRHINPPRLLFSDPTQRCPAMFAKTSLDAGRRPIDRRRSFRYPEIRLGKKYPRYGLAAYGTPTIGAMAHMNLIWLAGNFVAYCTAVAASGRRFLSRSHRVIFCL
jgi:hypothetical protein